MKPCLFTIVLLTVTQTIYANSVSDSLVLNRISNLNDLAYEHININPNLAFKYVDSSLTLNSIDSLSHLEFSNSFTILGILNKNKGFYQISVSNYLRALQSSELLKDWKRVSVYYNNIGVIYYLNGEYKDALSYYRRSVSIEQKIGTKEQLSIRYYNMGESYQALNHFDSSLFFFNTSLLIEKELENDIGVTYALYGLSNLYLSKQNYDSSQYYIDVITNQKETLNDLELNCKILIARTELAIHDKSYSVALEYILKVKQLSQEYSYAELFLTSLEKINLIYDKTGNTNAQISVLKELKEIQSNRYKKHVTIKIGELQKLFEQESQEREIDKLKSIEKINEIEINHSKKVKTYLFFTVSLVILIFIFNIISLNRLRNRNN
jgi:tetratricopeptide (TPR) repeat protein